MPWQLVWDFNPNENWWIKLWRIYGHSPNLPKFPPAKVSLYTVYGQAILARSSTGGMNKVANQLPCFSNLLLNFVALARFRAYSGNFNFYSGNTLMYLYFTFFVLFDGAAQFRIDIRIASTIQFEFQQTMMLLYNCSINFCKWVFICKFYKYLVIAGKSHCTVVVIHTLNI